MTIFLYFVSLGLILAVPQPLRKNLPMTGKNFVMPIDQNAICWNYH